MAYISRTDLLSLISDSQLDNFTDDLGDQTEIAANLQVVIQTASNEADSYVASIYATPFVGNIPSKIKTASLIFACESLYARRLTPEQHNPFKARADMWRKLLTDIGAGKQPLDESFTRVVTPVVSITQPSIISVNPLTGAQQNTF